MVYRQENNREVFLTRAYAQDLEGERLSYEEAKASSRRLRAAGKTLTNTAILQEALEHDALTDGKKTRKQRQKEEQKLMHSQPDKPKEQVESQSIEPESTKTQSEPEIYLDSQIFEPINFDELRGDW